MPTLSSQVGTLAIPVVPGDVDSRIADPTVDGLLSFFAEWIKTALDPKLVKMTRPTVGDACPEANRHAVDPSRLVQRFARPALFIWGVRDSYRKRTILIDERVRELQLMYVFDRVRGVQSLETHAGLMGVVSAAIQRGISRGSHPSYAAGQQVRFALGLNELTYLGGQEGFLQEFPETSIRESASVAGTRKQPRALGKGGAETIQEGFPSFHATLRVAEEIGDDTPVDPDDVARDIVVTTRVGDNGGVDVLSHVLYAHPTERDGE